ncbi:hypothetical protein D3C75_640890 [compost metagenome]
MPIKPYTTEGIPTNRSVTGRRISRIHWGAILAINTAPPKAMGKESSTDSRVSTMVLKKNGNAPNLPSLGVQSREKKNELKDTSRKVWVP